MHEYFGLPQSGSNMLNILVIDDNDDFRNLLVKLLVKEGIYADSAGDGQTGLSKFLNNSHKYDAILLDIQMSLLNGYEVLEGVRKTETGKAIPVIAMSGSVNEGTVDSFDYILKKPFKFEGLLPTIIAVIERKKGGGL